MSFNQYLFEKPLHVIFTHTSNSKAQQNALNQTVGARVGDGLGSTGASYGASTGTSQSKQTVLTSLTGENVTIDVENNTHVKGALIAAGETNEQGAFKDNGKLNLSTGTLTFANSTNSQYSSSNSYSVGTNIGYTTGKNTQTNVEETTGKVNSSTLSLSNEMGYSRSKTLATVGEGTLHVKDTENSDELERLNRDTTKVNKELYSGNVGTSVTATLDHRLLTEDGQDQIKKEFDDMDENMNAIAKTLPNAKSDNPVEAVAGTVWDTLATATGGILPTEANHGGLLANVSVIAGDKDSNFKVTGDSDSTLVYLNGMLNTLPDAIQGGNNLIGDKPHQNWYNPTHGIIGDTLESATDLLLNQFGIQTGISKQVAILQNNGTAWEIYLHSQGNLIAKAGANTDINTYRSYGAPLSSAEIEKIFGIKNEENIQKNKGDFVAKPINIFWIPNWFEPGHGTENYGAAKEKYLRSEEEK